MSGEVRDEGLETETGDARGAAEHVPPEDHILVVDDDEDAALLRAFVRILRGPFPGVGFDTAKNGQEALTAALALRDNLHKRLLLVVSDTMMPEMTGVELYDALRKIPGFEDLPFILLSGGMFDSTVERRFREIQTSGDEFFDFIEKPANPSKLVSVAKRLVALRAQRRAAAAEVASGLTGKPEAVAAGIDASAETVPSADVEPTDGSGPESVPGV